VLIPELELVLKAARSLAPDELPQLLGELETVRAVAWSRLTAPAPAPLNPQAPDELLDVKTAAGRLHLSVGYLYRHHDLFPFSRRVGRSLRFSNSGIDDYIQHSGALPNRRRRAMVRSEEKKTT
jgi:predicted DNA-binding transcriptional regulator AlpA